MRPTGDRRWQGWGERRAGHGAALACRHEFGLGGGAQVRVVTFIEVLDQLADGEA